MFHSEQNRPSEFINPIGLFISTLKIGNRNEICRASGVQPIIKPTSLKFNSLNYFNYARCTGSKNPSFFQQSHKGTNFIES